MSWAMLVACFVFLATRATDGQDFVSLTEKIASPYASAQQASSHFQLGSGAGSDPGIHGTKNDEPANSMGHPQLRTSPVHPTSREFRNVVVTARNLQDIPLNGIFGKLTGVFQASISLVSQLCWRVFQLNISPFYAFLWPIGGMISLAIACMRPGDNGGGGNNHHNKDLPPYYDPANTRYNLRSWLIDLNLWICQTTRPVHSQAAAIVQQLGGTARLLGRQITTNELMNGGEIRGVHVDPVSYIVLTLHMQFGQLETENQIIAMTEFFAFERKGNESINEVLARYDIVRHRAAEEGNFVMDVTGCCIQIFRALHIETPRIVQLLRPFGGTFPQTEEQFQQMLSQLRVEGRILENIPGNIGQTIQQGNRQAPQHTYLAQAENRYESNRSSLFFSQGQGGESQFDCGEVRCDPQGTVSQPTFMTHSRVPDRVQSSFPVTSYPVTSEAPTVVGDESAYWDEFSSGTDSDTSSDDFEGNMDDDDLQGLDRDEQYELLYFQKSYAKRRFRRFTGKPVRKVRRFYKKRGESWAKQGKGRGKGRRTFMFGKFEDSALVQEANAFLSKDMKAGTHTSGKGFGRKGNPIGKDGKRLTCHECGSEDHLRAQCPRRNGGTLLTKSQLFQKHRKAQIPFRPTAHKVKSRQAYLSEFIERGATSAPSTAAVSPSIRDNPVTLFTGFTTNEYQGPFSPESLAQVDPPPTMVQFVSPVLMVNPVDDLHVNDPWAAPAGSLRLGNTICPRRSRSLSPNRNHSDNLLGLPSVNHTGGLWDSYTPGQGTMPDRTGPGTVNTFTSRWVPTLPTSSRQSQLSHFIQSGTGNPASAVPPTIPEVPASRAQSPRSPRTHPYGTAPAQAGGPAGVSALSMSGPSPSPAEVSGSGSASASAVPALATLNYAPSSGLPSNLHRPLYDPVNNVQAPSVSALIQGLVAQMDQQQIPVSKNYPNPAIPGFGVTYDTTHQLSRFFGTPSAPPLAATPTGQQLPTSTSVASVPIASATASQAGSSRSGRRAVAKRRTRNEEQTANANQIFSNMTNAMYRTNWDEEGPKPAKLAGPTLPMYMTNPQLLAMNSKGRIPTSPLQSLMNNPNAPKSSQITKTSAWADDQIAGIATVSQVRLQNSHRERDYMLGSVLPNVYSAPTGYHEMNRYTLQDDANLAGDELDGAISEDGSSTRSVTPPPKAAPAGARPEQSPSARAATPPPKSAPTSRAEPTASAELPTASSHVAQSGPTDQPRVISHVVPTVPITKQPPPTLDQLAATTARENTQLTETVRQLTESLSELRVSNMQLQSRLDDLTNPTVIDSAAPSQYLGDNTECTICLQTFVQSEYLIRLGCGHIFHQSCWNRQGIVSNAARFCPNCRAPNARPRGLWAHVRTDIDTQLLPDGTTAENLLTDTDVVMLPAEQDPSIESQVPSRPDPQPRSGPYTQDVSQSNVSPTPTGSLIDLTLSPRQVSNDAPSTSTVALHLAVGDLDFSNVFGLRPTTPDLGNISSTTEAELLARVQAMQVALQQTQSSEGSTTHTVSQTPEPQFSEVSGGVNFGPWQELPVPETGASSLSVPLDSATGPAPEGFSLTPTTTPRVNYTDLGVPIVDLEAEQIPVYDLTDDSPDQSPEVNEALPAFPATTDDSETLADDWISGQNRLEISSPEARQMSSPHVRTAREFLPVDPRKQVAEARQMRSFQEGTINLAKHEPGMSAREAPGSSTIVSQDPQGPVIDTGSLFNFCGDHWARAFDNMAYPHQKFAHWQTRPSTRAPQFSGVGHGTQQAILDVKLPMAMMTTDGTPAVGTFDAPCLQNSDIPGIFGLKSLEENGAVLDIAQNKLYLLGEGAYDLMSCFPPGTKCFELQRSATGHLVLPAGRFEEVEAAQRSASSQGQSSSSVLQLQGATEHQRRETEKLVTELQAAYPDDDDIAGQITECAQYLIDNQEQIDTAGTVTSQVSSQPLESVQERPVSRNYSVAHTKAFAHAKTKDTESRKRAAYAAWGVTAPPVTRSTGLAQQPDDSSAPEFCHYCRRPTTDSRGIQTVMWTTMLVPTSEMTATPCCSVECLLNVCSGQDAAKKKAMIKKWKSLHPSQPPSISFIPDAVVSPEKRHLFCFDRSKIAPANTSETPQRGKDSRALANYPSPNQNPCNGCRCGRARSDWSHNREIGTCYFPFDEPNIWECDACMHHLPRFHAGHTGVPGECRWEYATQHSITVRDDKSPGRTVKNTKTVTAEIPPSEGVYDSDDDHPMSFLHADGTHSTGTRRDFINRVGRENVRWAVSDQGIRYPVDARAYPEDEESDDMFDTFSPEAGHSCE